MLSTSTVLVLGAGASKPYGFPTGAELSARLIEQLREGQSPFDKLTKVFGFSPTDVTRFRDAFYFSGKNSVDSFLEHRTEYLDIGKAATAIILVGYEQHWGVFRYDSTNWLRYVYNNLNTSFDEFGFNKLSIVTFNYDRVVEHFLFTSLKNTYGKSDDECRRAIEAIPIIHLHGHLGYLPWQSDSGRPFEPTDDPRALQEAAKSIKIIHEGISDGRDKDFERAKSLMQSAEQVRFLGFGYNKTNIDRLEIARLKRPARGTSVGLNGHEQATIAKLCGGMMSFNPGDCLQILRENIVWD